MNREELQRIQNLLEEWLTDGAGNPVWSEIVSAGDGGAAEDALLGSLLGADGGVDLALVLDTLGQLPGLTEQCMEQLDVLQQVHSKLPDLSRRCADVNELLGRARRLVKALREDEQPEEDAEELDTAEEPQAAVDEMPEPERQEPAAADEAEEPVQEAVDRRETPKAVETTDVEDDSADEKSDSQDASAGEMLDDLGAMEQELDRCRQVREKAIERLNGTARGGSGDRDEDEEEDAGERSQRRRAGRGRQAKFEPSGTCLGGGGYKDITRVFDDLYGRMAPRPVESREDVNPWEDEIEDAAGAKNTFGNQLLGELDQIETQLFGD